MAPNPSNRSNLEQLALKGLTRTDRFVASELLNPKVYTDKIRMHTSHLHYLILIFCSIYVRSTDTWRLVLLVDALIHATIILLKTYR